LSKTISIDKLGVAIADELTLYHDAVIEGVKKEAKKSMSRLVKETKATAPVGRRRKHYRDSITSKKLGETSRDISYLWYVKGSDYRLSHLLENGHALHWGGRVEGTHFIKKASDPIIDEYCRAVEEVIKNG
jgi:hypothetical protein